MNVQQLKDVQSVIEAALNKYGDIVLSKNERNNVFVMSIEEYRKKLLDEEIDRKIMESEEDYNNGRVKDAEEVFKEWEEQYGI